MVSKMVDLSDDRWNKLDLFVRTRIINSINLFEFTPENEDVIDCADSILLMIARGRKRPHSRSRYYKSIKLNVEEINLHLKTSGTKAYFEKFGFDTTFKIHGWWN